MKFIKMFFAVLILFGLFSVTNASASMSNKSQTTWTFATTNSQVYKAPRYDRRDGNRRLQLHTQNGSDAVVIVNKTLTDGLGDKWVQIRIPGKRRPLTRWVRSSALSEFQVNKTRVSINLKSHKLTVFRGNKAIWSSMVGVGANGTPTARGSFWIAERFTGSRAVYGPVTFTTSARSPKGNIPGFGSTIGIHGAVGLGSSRGNVSHGCIRVADIGKLASFVDVGTRVDIK